MKNNSVLIIANNEQKGQLITEKTKLLRECDQINLVKSPEGISEINKNQPSLIIIYNDSLGSINLIKDIREEDTYNKIPIIFVMDTFNEEILLNGYDAGIDDFFFLDEADSIILIRILLTLQKAVLYKQTDINNEILRAGGFLEKGSNIYLKEKAPIVLKQFFNQCIKDNSNDTVFMYIRPESIKSKKPKKDVLGKAIKRILRGDDVAAYGKGNGYYLILYNVKEENIEKIANRIKEKLKKKYNLYINAAKITTSFEELEEILYTSMQAQIDIGVGYNFIKELTIKENKKTMEMYDENGKSFQEFKKEFYKHIEKILAPVFYQEKTKNEEKYKDVKIEYSIEEEESIFSIEKEDVKSELKITYPTYINLIIDIIHNEKNQKPILRRKTYEFEDISEEKINEIIEDMIREFVNKKGFNEIFYINE